MGGPRDAGDFQYYPPPGPHLCGRGAGAGALPGCGGALRDELRRPWREVSGPARHHRAAYVNLGSTPAMLHITDSSFPGFGRKPETRASAPGHGPGRIGNRVPEAQRCAEEIPDGSAAVTDDDGPTPATAPHDLPASISFHR